ncbi:MAG: hypothetical protein HND44_23510 [Chloroflexi bacterium]|nr:hypothetical protein [Ardenticatenaceae bacterium]MBL1131404.1 hypothetical protein [Chloroflexota bacterium]NOG37511.1 hypothetical protein [Chloroflexota bacterium]
MRRQNSVAIFAPWLAVLGILLVVILPLWGAPPYGDDVRLHIYRIPVVQAFWAVGVPFARWAPTLNLGYGSPLFNFYPPLSAYLLTWLYLLADQQAAVAWNVLLVLALLAGGVGMFLVGRWLYGPASGILAAALYTWSPHLVYQSFARGSSSNALAMALFPWAAWGLLAVAARPSPLSVLLAALPTALLMLSHTAASLLFLGPLLVLAVTAVLVSPAPCWPRLAAVLLALGLGLALSAFAWLPALAEIGDTRYAQEAGNVAYQDHFADAFRWPEPTIAGVHNPGLPKTPGLAQIALGALGTALAVVVWWRGRRAAAGWQAAVTAVFGLMGLAVLGLSLAWSAPLWAALPPLQGLQFPWRLLDIPAFYLALTGGFILYRPFLVRRSRWVAAGWLAVVVALVLAFANMLPYLYPPRLHSLPAQPSLADVTAVQQQFGIYGLTAWGEYSAATVTIWPAALPFPGADEMVPLDAKVLHTPAGLTAVAGDPWRAVWQANLAQAETITLAVHHFPGWQAWLDGEKTAVGADADGRIQIAIPPGSHQLELAFTRTPVRWLADGLTLVGLVIVGVLLVLGRTAVRPKKATTPNKVADNRRIISLALILCLLLGSKIIWFDRVSNWLVVHPVDGRIPGKTTPDYGSFNAEIRLAGYEAQAPHHVMLIWQAVAAPTSRYAVVVTLADAQGRPLHVVVNDAPGYMSTSHWQPGQLTRDVYDLPLPEQPAPAGYTVWVGLQDVVTGEEVTLSDAESGTAVPVGRFKTPPPILNVADTQGVIFGEAIRLQQADVPDQVAVGELLELRLVWESLATVAADYTVFVHFLHPDGTLAAGQDGQPLDGRYPTSYWSPGEQIMDVRRWQPDLPPGVYQLEVGLYRLETGERLPVSGPQSGLGDRVIVGNVAVGGGE